MSAGSTGGVSAGSTVDREAGGMPAADRTHLRVLLAAFGDPGHAFPAIALGRALADRGHEVCLQTWTKWREHVEREGVRFAPAPEYQVFPTRQRPLKPYQAAVHAARATQPLIAELDPDVVVADILTIAAGLAAELAGRPWVTLVPHVLPTSEPGFPPYSVGAQLPRTAVGRTLWRTLDPLLRRGLEQGREELNGARARLGLPPLSHHHGGISRQLALIATFPQLEYPRRSWPEYAHVTGPLLWEQPYPETELPSGEGPLVLLAPSTSQDPKGRLLAAALAGLADEPVRVLAATNRPGAETDGLAVPANARLVDWVAYSKTMPHCDAVVCHGGHGTVARALACGVPLVACPAAGDMAENGARVAWAGAGVSLPRRLATPRGVRLAVRRVLSDRRYGSSAMRLAKWARQNGGSALAADVLEQFMAERAVR
jgi:MGT family glycosyltransferase